MKKIINYLIEEGCPSIKYRIKKEIFNEIDSNLYKQILNDQKIKEIVDRQNKIGWIDEDFHSESGVETAARVFFEKGIDISYSPYKKMLNELERRDETFDNGSLSKVGKILDEEGFGGSKLMRAVAFTYAGLDNKSFVKEEIKNTLDCFRYLTKVSSVNQITEEYKNKLIFSEGVKWPSIYHLRLLAYSNSWRNNNNKNMIIDSIKKLIKFSPIPDISVFKNHQFISAASFCMNDFDSNLAEIDDKEWMMWFHRMELLSRLGVVNEIQELRNQVKTLITLIKEDDNLFKKKLNHYYFRKWSPYIGLALEKDWRSSKRRISDLSFRSLLIIFYSGIGI
ncbi:hypothetical protein [Sporosalibacterium faouarense]|uniref:hypothetical protein n=1 Tax=Sporosalibacterium faouarense TaxID=516123 RepID=UPI00192AC5F5|nr:hypothetical protein [Sporosalibacterium faouarense]